LPLKGIGGINYSQRGDARKKRGDEGGREISCPHLCSERDRKVMRRDGGENRSSQHPLKERAPHRKGGRTKNARKDAKAAITKREKAVRRKLTVRKREGKKGENPFPAPLGTEGAVVSQGCLSWTRFAAAGLGATSRNGERKSGESQRPRTFARREMLLGELNLGLHGPSSSGTSARKKGQAPKGSQWKDEKTYCSHNTELTPKGKGG